jgi:hypothetical protein
MAGSDCPNVNTIEARAWLRATQPNLQAPICPERHIEMMRFRSEPMREAPSDLIPHEFVCPGCKRTRRTNGVDAKAGYMPEKHSAPRFFAVSACTA